MPKSPDTTHGPDMLSPQQVADALGVHRATVYRIPWLRDRWIYVGPRSPRLDRADLELFKALHRGAPDHRRVA